MSNETKLPAHLVLATVHCAGFFQIFGLSERPGEALFLSDLISDALPLPLRCRLRRPIFLVQKGKGPLHGRRQEKSARYQNPMLKRWLGNYLLNGFALGGFMLVGYVISGFLRMTLRQFSCVLTEVFLTPCSFEGTVLHGPQLPGVGKK